MIASTLIIFSLLGVSSAATQELNRSKRQFIIDDGADVVHPQVLYRYRAAEASPYFTGVTPTIVAPRPVYYQTVPVIQRRPVYYRPAETVQYVPVRSVYRARPQIILERPMATVIQPARVLALHRPSNPVFVELEKRRRMMAKH